MEDRDIFLKKEMELLTFYKFQIPSICINNGICNIYIYIECTFRDKIYIITCLLENQLTATYLITPKYNTELIFETVTDILSTLIDNDISIENEDLCSMICKIYQIYGLLLQSKEYVNKIEYHSYYKLICEYGYKFLSSSQSTKVYIIIYI